MGAIVDLDLRRMTAARDATRDLLAKIDRAIRTAAEQAVIFTHIDEHAFHRGTTAWSARDEREYQEAVARLKNLRSHELGTLSAKLARQDAAIRKRIAGKRPRPHP